MDNNWASGAERRRPRVLFYSPAAEFKGGAERSLMDLVASPGIDAMVVCPGEGAVATALLARGVTVHILPFGLISGIRRPFKLRDGARALVALFTCATHLNRIARREKADFVHSNGLKAHVVATVARLLGGAPAIVHIRDIPLTAQEKLVWHLLGAAATRLVLVSRACWPWKKLPAKAEVIFNGINIRDLAALRQDTEPMVLGFFGRIHQAKGLHLLIDWVKATVSAGFATRLIIRGTFYDEAGDYEAELNEQIGRLGLEEIVEFQGFRNDPATVYEGIDIVCVPSHVPDPLPRAVMEAMALGLCVIAYPAGGILEMIDNGKDGFLAADEFEFIEALRHLQDRAERTKISGYAVERAKAQFSLDRLHSSIDRLYCSLLPLSSNAPGPVDATIQTR